MLEAGGALIDLREAAVAARAERLRRSPDPEWESRRRVSALLDQRRSDHELNYLDRLVADLIVKADLLDPPDVTARILAQQSVVDNLLRTPLLPHQQFRLFMLAGHLAGLLAISLVDVDELVGANTCCLEAAVFTELTGHEGLRAWTLAVHELIDAAAARGCSANAGRQPQAADRTPPSLAPPVGAGSPAEHGPQPDGSAAFEPAIPGGDGDASLDEMLIAPGGQDTPPRLIALVKGRIARFATANANAHRTVPPAGISHAFQPPV